MAVIVRGEGGAKYGFHGAVVIQFEDGSLLVREKNNIYPLRVFTPGEWTSIEHEEDEG